MCLLQFSQKGLEKTRPCLISNAAVFKIKRGHVFLNVSAPSRKVKNKLLIIAGLFHKYNDKSIIIATFVSCSQPEIFSACRKPVNECNSLKYITVMIENERNCRHEHVINIARQMMTAARTAPKGKGVDVIEVALVTGEELQQLSETMLQLAEETGMKFFIRDANNILQAESVVIIGTHEHAQGLNCGHCGFSTCDSRTEGVPCAINSVDVGIAIGSACATAADMRVDTRVMFSAGLAAQRLNYLEGCKSVYAIPVSASSKNPFFDRKSPVQTIK